MIFKFSNLVQNVYQNVARVEFKKKKKTYFRMAVD